MLTSEHACAEQRPEPETWTIVARDSDHQPLAPAIGSRSVCPADGMLRGVDLLNPASTVADEQ